MEALRKQASKFKEQVAKQQQVRILLPNARFSLPPLGSVLLPLREENGRLFAVFGCLMCREAAARMWRRDFFRF